MTLMETRAVSAGERERKRVKITGGRRSGTEPNYVAHIFVFIDNTIVYKLYKLTLSDQAQVTLQLRIILFDLV
jgi:hypothetical protein